MINNIKLSFILFFYKNKDVWRNLTKDNKNNQPDLIIGADTIVS